MRADDLGFPVCAIADPFNRTKISPMESPSDHPIAKAAAWLRADAMELLIAIGDIENAGPGPALASIEADYTYLKKTLQRLVKEAGILGSAKPAADPATEEPSVTAGKTGRNDRTELVADALRPTGRRPHRNDFDAALLVSANMGGSVAYPHPVGLDTLFKVASALDSETKRASLVAKLNRWKGENLLRWRDHTEIHTLPNGIQRLKDLHRLCSAPGGGMDQVRTAVKSVLGVDPNFPS